MRSLHTFSKPVKIALGVISVWPLIYIPLFMSFLFSNLFFTSPNGIPSQFLSIFILQTLTVLSNIILLIFYIIDIFNNEHLKGEKKTLWTIVLFFGGMIAMPIYWYLYVW